MANIFCHVELASDHPKQAKKFYSKLFDWQFQDMPMGGEVYYGFNTADKAVGGGMYQKKDPKQPTGWLTYVLVDSVARSLTKAQKLGGAVCVPKTPIPGMGFFAVLKDPTGGVIGIFEATAPKKPAKAPAKRPAKKPAKKPVKKAK